MWFELVGTALVGLLLYYLLLSSRSPPRYWKKHGIPFIDSSVVASEFEIFMGKKSSKHRDDYAYEKMGSAKYCGMIESPDPVILLKDLDLIKKVAIKDFDHFVDRRDFFTVADDSCILRKMLGMLKGQEWKDVRSTVSPTFSTAKIRKMMEHFNGVSKEWVQMLKSKAESNPLGSTTIDVVNTVNQYTVDVIGATVFGMNTGTVQDPEAIFNQMVGRLSDVGVISFLKQNLSPRYPKLFKFLGIEALNMESINFFEKILRQSMEARRSGNVRRNDFQQLLIDAQDGELKAAGLDELTAFEKEASLGVNGIGKHVTLTDDMVVAQSILFFLAGFQTTSTSISFMVYFLAAHPDIQERLWKEVNAIVKEDGSVDYDELGKLTFMEMFVNEVLRHFPIAVRVERICNKDYHDPDSGLFVRKGGVVSIPINAIHHDEKYYPNPEKFTPENFTPENKAKRSPYAFLPFGIGPRNCIGMRFAVVESKAAIAHLVHAFKIEPTSKTPLPVQGFTVAAQWLTPRNLELKLTPRY